MQAGDLYRLCPEAEQQQLVVEMIAGSLTPDPPKGCSGRGADHPRKRCPDLGE